MRKRNVEKQKQQSFLQGILPGLVPITLLSFFFVPDYIPGLWKLAAGSMIPLLPGLGITLLFRFPTAGRILIHPGRSVFLTFALLCAGGHCCSRFRKWIRYSKNTGWGISSVGVTMPRHPPT